MKTWAVRNSLDWVTCYPLHFTLAYIVYWESLTHQVVYIHCTLWRPRWNIHRYRQSFDWFVTLLHYLFSNKKKIRVLVVKSELLISCHTNERQSAVHSPQNTATAHCGLRSTQMSGQFSIRSMPRQRVAQEKLQSQGDFVKFALRGLYIDNFVNKTSHDKGDACANE